MAEERRAGGRVHYAWIVAAVTFLVLLSTAGVRATPGILIVPLEQEFGWSRALISAAVAINIALFGIIGPFAASLMARYGVRRVVLTALALMSTAVMASSFMRSSWQLFLCWGLLVGMGTGVTSLVLAAVVVTRWFEQRRGLTLGVLSAANATGQLVFLPMLARVVESSGWRSVTHIVAGSAALVFVVVLLLMRNQPADMGLLPYGAEAAPTAPAQPARKPLQALVWAARSREFWILAGTFFICGASTNGLIGTHLIPACMDHGIPEVTAAGLLAVMGIFDMAGTTASGWLTDRFNSRHLLFWYYALRGLALLFLPASLMQASHGGLSIFAVFYGLDWVATVPPTVRLATNAFGRENAGVVYGWIFTAHQVGASLAAVGAGSIRTYLGDYRDAFWISGVLCLVAAMAFLISRKHAPLPLGTVQPAEETA